MKLSAPAIIVLSTLAAVSSWAGDTTSWSLGGSFLAQPSMSYASAGALSSTDFLYGSSNTLSLDLRATGDRARGEASLETAVLTGAAARAAWTIAASPYARADELLLPAPSPGAPAPEVIAAARVRTLYLKLDLDWAALTAGRQVINYGRGALWSPTDIFSELDLTGLSPVRRGSDALRLVVPLGATEGIDLVAAPSAAPADGRYALRARGLVAGVDAALMAARDGAGRGTVFGADFKADLEIGFYGETSYELFDSGGPGTFKAAAGADYSFGDFLVAAEYYYNGGGAASDLLFPGSHNIYGSLAWRATELLQFTGSVVWDLTDRSGTATLLAEVSVAQNATLGSFFQFSYGQPTFGLALDSGSSTWAAAAGLAIRVTF